MSSSAQLLESLIKDTDRSLSSLESRPDLMEQVSDIEKKYAEASEIKEDKERELRLKVLESDFRQLREMSRQEEQDLASAVFGLNAILEGMGRDYMELGQLNPAEQKLIADSEAEIAAAKQERLEAEQTWNIFGRKAKAIAEADQKIKATEAKIEEAKNQARRLARQRLMSADMEHSLQDFMHRVSKTVSIMEHRMKEIDKQLQAVATRKGVSFDVKQKAAEALEKLDADLNEREADLRREEEIIQTLVNGTKEHADQTQKVSNLRAQVEELRGKRNTAFVLFQSKEKFAAELEIHEKTLMNAAGIKLSNFILVGAPFSSANGDIILPVTVQSNLVYGADA